MKSFIPVVIFVSLMIGVVLFNAPFSFTEETHADISPKIGISQVKAGGEIGRRIDITINNNLLKLDADKDFLLPFQQRGRTGGYIGLGKLIDSLVRFSSLSASEPLRALKSHVIEEIIKTQEDDGYIGMMIPEKRMWALWDIHEMAYIVNGLTSDYEFFQNQSSLDSAVRLMDYIMTRWRENPAGMDDCPITVFMAVTGLEEALLMLHQATGDSKYLDFCRNFRKLPQWDSHIVLGRFSPIEGHAYAYMHRCLAQLRLHQIDHDPRLLEKSRSVIDFLTHGDGLLVNGVCSQHECWHDSQDGTEGLGETCATAYLIRLLDELMRMQEDPLYGDIMERSIFNGLFAAQSPGGRKLRYYVPFEGPRVYFDGDTYCCPCNYRRIVAELPGMIYYRMKGGLAVNLYTPSEASLEWIDDASLRIEQETDYPNSGDVQIRIDPSKPVAFPLYLRIPRWCEEAELSVNGEILSRRAGGGSFYPVSREWKKGDVVQLRMPMPWRLIKGRKAQAGRVAVMRGPQLFCLNPEKNQEISGVDLRQIYIDPETIEGPFPDDAVRPDGLACRIKGWKSMGFSTGGGHNLDLYLTEFPDPDGVFTYFRVRRMDAAGVPDELSM
ncbi:MAG: glycoside hydrolase family 127 protein [Candidatus Omnitrophica bacterium]|nr:glycoside hydrolase family 127 protein [Candidatus Omnitrophota bacterium]